MDTLFKTLICGKVYTLDRYDSKSKRCYFDNEDVIISLIFINEHTERVHLTIGSKWEYTVNGFKQVDNFIDGKRYVVYLGNYEIVKED